MIPASTGGRKGKRSALNINQDERKSHRPGLFEQKITTRKRLHMRNGWRGGENTKILERKKSKQGPVPISVRCENVRKADKRRAKEKENERLREKRSFHGEQLKYSRRGKRKVFLSPKKREGGKKLQSCSFVRS